MTATIMIVDDSQMTRHCISKILENAGYETVEAVNGKDAIQRLKTLPSLPEVIICDILMPEMDGYTFFGYVSRIPQLNHIPFIFLSVKSASEDIRTGKSLGVDDYLVKPCKAADLLASVKGKLARLKSRKMIQTQMEKRFLNKIPGGKTDPPIYSMNSDNVSDHCEILPKNAQYMLMMVKWDDIKGPVVTKQKEHNMKIKIPLDEIGEQLFYAVNTIYGNLSIRVSVDLLFHMANLSCDSHLLVDFQPNEKARNGYEIIIVAIIAPSIAYLTAQSIKQLLISIAEREKANKKWEFDDYVPQLNDIFQTILVIDDDVVEIDTTCKPDACEQ